MKPLSAPAAKVFLSLIADLEPGQARTIENSGGTYMAVNVDCLTEKLYAVAHNYIQNGDVCPDPDVEFCVVGDKIFPTAIDHGRLGYFRYVEFGDDGAIKAYRPKGQRDLATFCAMWLRNIKEQQRL